MAEYGAARARGKMHSPPQQPGCDLRASPNCHVSRLFRRREVWLPTAWGWTLLVAVAVVVALVALPRVGGFLAPSSPASGRDGRGAQLLVVEGWLDEDALRAAVEVARSGRYATVATSGGPIETWRELQPWPSYAERAADWLRRHGVTDVRVSAVPAPAAPQDRSFLSAAAVRDWARTNGIAADAVDVFSSSVHARRSWLLYRMAFGSDVEVGIVAATPTGYSLDRWWATSEGTKAVLGEVVSLAWTKCCFWPPAADGGDERRPAPLPRSPA